MERIVTDEQLDVLVEQRMAERKKVVDEVVAALQPHLEGIRKEAASANHVKRTLGRQLASLERLVKQTNAELGRHVTLPAHPGTADVVQRMDDALERGEELTAQFGVDSLSLEQKQALPWLLKNYVNEQTERQAIDRRARRRSAVTQVVTTFLGTVFGAIAAIAAILTYLAQTPHAGGR
jgi:hypothetical protein